MRSLILLAAVLVLSTPLSTCGQQYACGEPTETAPGEAIRSKATSAIKKLSRTVNILPQRESAGTNSEIKLADFQEEIPYPNASPRSAAAIDSASSPLRRDDVAQIPASVPDETNAADVNQVRFLDQPLELEVPGNARSRLSDEQLSTAAEARPRRRQANAQRDNRQLLRRPDRAIDTDRGILDPAQKFTAQWEALPSVPTIDRLISRNASATPEQFHVRSRDRRQMSPEEIAAYVRNRRRSGFRWPWSR